MVEETKPVEKIQEVEIEKVEVKSPSPKKVSWADLADI